ncbi:MAG: hypothetical protein FJY99_12300 [Candidatus Sericytochromatia bacterium]|nr:hypothetical protein [Candidatus Tanganyikabacteria bacterium]
MSSKLSLLLAALAVVATSAPALAAADPTRYLDVDQARVLGTGVMATTMGTSSKMDFRYGLMKDVELAVGYDWSSGQKLDEVAKGSYGLGVKYAVGTFAGLNIAGKLGVKADDLSNPGTGLGYDASLPIGVGLGGLNLDVQPYLSGSTTTGATTKMGTRVGIRQNVSTNTDLLVRAGYEMLGSAGSATVETGLRYNLGGGGWLDLGLIDWNSGDTIWGKVSLTFVGNR